MIILVGAEEPFDELAQAAVAPAIVAEWLNDGCIYTGR